MDILRLLDDLGRNVGRVAIWAAAIITALVAAGGFAIMLATTDARAGSLGMMGSPDEAMVERAHVLAEAYSGLEVPEDAERPRFVIMSLPIGFRAMIQRARYSGVMTIMLNGYHWGQDEERDLSTMVHELVHWRQVASGWIEGRMRCQVERSAYMIAQRAVPGAQQEFTEGALQWMSCYGPNASDISHEVWRDGKWTQR